MARERSGLDGEDLSRSSDGSHVATAANALEGERVEERAGRGRVRGGWQDRRAAGRRREVGDDDGSGGGNPRGGRADAGGGTPAGCLNDARVIRSIHDNPRVRHTRSSRSSLVSSVGRAFPDLFDILTARNVTHRLIMRIENAIRPKLLVLSRRATHWRPRGMVALVLGAMIYSIAAIGVGIVAGYRRELMACCPGPCRKPGAG